MLNGSLLEIAVKNEARRIGITDENDYDGYLLALFSYTLNGLQGKRILDIGCGGMYSTELTSSTGQVRTFGFPPTFPRLAKNYGVDAVGIDPTVDPKGENFEAYKDSVENLPKIFPYGETFDGVLIKKFWDQHGLRNRTRNLQKATYHEIYRLLRKGGVSINAQNDRIPMKILPTQDELEEIGFEIIFYYPGNGTPQDMIVLRKPRR